MSVLWAPSFCMEGGNIAVIVLCFYFSINPAYCSRRKKINKKKGAKKICHTRLKVS